MSAVREDGDTTTTLYEYDDNGNLVKETDGTETKTYTYNLVNKLITATISEGNNVTLESYDYDYEGNRINKQTKEEAKSISKEILLLEKNNEIALEILNK